MANYDPAIIQKLADKLYSQANSVVVIWTLVGLILGAILGAGYGRGSDQTMYMIVGALLVGFFGFAYGLHRSFMIRVQAQLALCQKQIEENTRRV